MKPQAVITFLSVVICLLLAALIGLILLPAKDSIIPAGDEDEKSKDVGILTVDTLLVTPAESFEITRSYSGVTKAGETVDLGFPRGGRVEKVLVDAGDQVKKGDILAELDKRRLVLEKKKVDDALKDEDKVISSRGGGGDKVTEEDAKLLDVELADSDLKAPFDGVILARQMAVGSMASAGMPVFRIVQKEKVKAWIGLPVDVVSGMKKDDFYDLEIGGQNFLAPLTAILPEVDSNTRTRTVVLTLDEDASEKHLPGEVVRLVLTRTNAIPGFWLPLSALTRETRGLWSVYKVVTNDKSEDHVERHIVEVIHVEGDWAWTRGTIDGETRIVAEGVHRIVPGQRVTVGKTSAEAGTVGAEATSEPDKDETSETPEKKDP